MGSFQHTGPWLITSYHNSFRPTFDWLRWILVFLTGGKTLNKPPPQWIPNLGEVLGFSGQWLPLNKIVRLVWQDRTTTSARTGVQTSVGRGNWIVCALFLVEVVVEVGAQRNSTRPNMKSKNSAHNSICSQIQFPPDLQILPSHLRLPTRWDSSNLQPSTSDLRSDPVQWFNIMFKSYRHSTQYFYILIHLKESWTNMIADEAGLAKLVRHWTSIQLESTLHWVIQRLRVRAPRSV